jgi:hypothetical protein
MARPRGSSWRPTLLHFASWMSDLAFAAHLGARYCGTFSKAQFAPRCGGRHAEFAQALVLVRQV